MSNDKKTIRVGVVGCGGISDIHIPSIQKAGAELVAVCDADRGRADWAVKYYSLPREPVYYGIKVKDAALVRDVEALPRERWVRGYYSLDDMLETEKGNIDVAFVLTREKDRPEAAIKCLEAGLHIFCEKALAERLRDAERMVKAAEENNRFFGIDHNYIFSPPYIKLKELVDAGELGKFCLINCMAHSSCYYHTLYLMRHFGGEIAEVRGAFEAETLFGGEWAYADFESKAAILEYADGGLGILVGSKHLPQFNLFNFSYIGTDARAEIMDVIGADLEIYPKEGGKKVAYHANFMERRHFGVTFENSVKAFIDAVSQNKEPPATGFDGLRNMQIEYAIVESKRTGEAVKPY